MAAAVDCRAVVSVYMIYSVMALFVSCSGLFNIVLLEMYYHVADGVQRESFRLEQLRGVQRQAMSRHR
jgi:hypothetical protein